jgi:peptide-methionine (S)-S-oxide reductase
MQTTLKKIIAISFLLTLSTGSALSQDNIKASFNVNEGQEAAIFAGGCFWCVEADFEPLEGVSEVISGYIDGENDNPTYRNHTSFGHREAALIKYDPDVISYGQLLSAFWRSVDPTDDGGQFCDRGHSYTTAIYAVDQEQLEIAKASKQSIEQQNLLSDDIVTPVKIAPQFWPAETYHQDYYKKNAAKYHYYRFACGRDTRVKAVWGDEAFKGLPHKRK